MELSFYKYQGAGNDFIMVDNRQKLISKNNTNLVKNLCDRKFGIGADGLILLEKPEANHLDFKMVYFNADGRESSMCGNGGRCIVAFANFLGITEETTSFLAIDGEHEGMISKDGIVGLKMVKVEEVKMKDPVVFLDTGSPHHIIFTNDIENLDIKTEGAAIRYSDTYKAIGGTNVNFVKTLKEDTFKVRTYERGVEDETLSCGTGVTAVALAAFATGRTKEKTIFLETKGGSLTVKFENIAGGFDDIWLYGPAQQVFKGDILC